MQKLEATLMIDQVTQRLIDAGIWCSTIHDSIVCLKKEADLVQALVLDVFEREVGLEPLMKVEALCPALSVNEAGELEEEALPRISIASTFFEVETDAGILFVTVEPVKETEIIVDKEEARYEKARSKVSERLGIQVKEDYAPAGEGDLVLTRGDDSVTYQLCQVKAGTLNHLRDIPAPPVPV